MKDASQFVRDTRLILSREASPFSRGGFEGNLLKSASVSIYDFDDALFNDIGGVRRLLGKDRKCRLSVQHADITIAGSEYLADWATQFSGNVTMIPTCVDPDMYFAKTSWQIDDVPRIIWLGSPSTEQYLVDIADALRDVHAQTGARLTVISGPAGALDLELGDMLDRVRWTAETFAVALSRGDVAIAPLRDDPFARGKCAYKVLQYAAAGLPIVGSPVGANALALERFTGWTVHSPEDWVRTLTEALSVGEDEREERARTGMLAVRKHYSFHAWSDIWAATVLGAS